MIEKRIILPGTSLEVSHLGFGTASLHHAFTSKKRQELLECAIDSGITHFDTARMYGEGIAERELGKFIKDRRSRVTIATKFGIPANALYESFPSLLYSQRAIGSVARHIGIHFEAARPRSLSPQAAAQSLAQSLNALNTDWVDILFVHEPQLNELYDLEYLSEWLLRQKKSGRVRYLGLSGDASTCVKLAQKLPKLFDLLQVEDSLAGREADALTHAGAPLQITFGYLRQANQQSGINASAVIQQALDRNSDGMVLFSTRKTENLKQLAALAA